MRWLVVIFVVVPLAELYLLLLIGDWIGFWNTVALTIVTGVLGGSLAKREGLKVWRQWRRALDELRPPESGVIEGVLVLIGGALLITPGVLTDITGLTLLLRPTRRAIAARIKQRLEDRIARGDIKVTTVMSGDFANIHRPGAGDVIETSGESVEDDRPVLPPRE
jgi:UPF0716 protein FxsA